MKQRTLQSQVSYGRLKFYPSSKRQTIPIFCSLLFSVAWCRWHASSAIVFFFSLSVSRVCHLAPKNVHATRTRRYLSKTQRVWPISISATLYCAFHGINSVSQPFEAQLTKVINLPIVADAKQSISWLSAGEKQINKQTSKQINNCPAVGFGLENVRQSHADFGCVSPTQ